MKKVLLVGLCLFCITAFAQTTYRLYRGNTALVSIGSEQACRNEVHHDECVRQINNIIYTEFARLYDQKHGSAAARNVAIKMIEAHVEKAAAVAAAERAAKEAEFAEHRKKPITILH